MWLHIVKVLINAGADVNVRDKYSGIMPLMIASSFYMGSDTAQPLIDAGAFVNARDRQDGMTPLFLGQNYWDCSLFVPTRVEYRCE